MNIKDHDPNNIKIDEKSYENIPIYYIGYVTIKKDLKIYSVNPLYLIFGKVNRYFEEINGNKYITLVPTKIKKIYENKKVWIYIKKLQNIKKICLRWWITTK